MEPEVVRMISGQLQQLHETCQGIRDDMQAHAEKDSTYWQKIDQQEGQISLIKLMAGGLSASGLVAWLYSNFGKH